MKYDLQSGRKQCGVLVKNKPTETNSDGFYGGILSYEGKNVQGKPQEVFL